MNTTWFLRGTLAVLVACGEGEGSNEKLAWDAAAPVVVGDALVVRLPLSGEAVALRPGAEPERLDLGAWRIGSLGALPSGEAAVARTSAVRCVGDDVAGIERVVYVADCPPEARLVPEGRFELLLGAAPSVPFEAGPWFGELTFSSDSRYAVAAIRPDADTTGGGLVSLDSVLVLDLVSGRRWEVPVGFRASRVVFTGPAEAVDGMVVLSQSEVAIVALTGDVPVAGTVYPLTLDADQVIDPLDVAVTPGDAYALIPVRGSSDLYVLDLKNPSINLVSLASEPTQMAVDPARDQTIFTYARRPLIEVLDHERFELRTVQLEEPAQHIELGPDHALLWSESSRDVVRIALDTLRVDEVRLNFLPTRLEVAPERDFAVTLASEASGRLELIDLRETDGRIPGEARPFGLDGRGLDVAFASEAEGTRLLLLQEGVDTLYALSWPSLQVEAVDLPEPPVRLGTLADGTFWITHNDALGLVSFLPASGELVSVADFAAYGVFDAPIVLTEGVQ